MKHPKLPLSLTPRLLVLLAVLLLALVTLMSGTPRGARAVAFVTGSTPAYFNGVFERLIGHESLRTAGVANSTKTASAAVAFPASPAAFACGGMTVTRLSSSFLYIDTATLSTVSAQYVGYKVCNDTGAAIADAWVKLTTSGAIVTLGTNEDGLYHIGPLAINQCANVYFYVKASGETVTAQNQTVELFNGNPTGGTLVCGGNVFGYTVEDLVSASQNKPQSVSISGDTNACFTVTTTGTTGIVGSHNNNNITYTPAAAPNWPADAYELTGVNIVYTGGPVGGVNDKLFVEGLSAPDKTYTITYTICKRLSVALPLILPITSVAGGSNNNKYGPLDPAVTVQLTALKEVSPTGAVSPGTLLTYTITITNTGTVAATSMTLTDAIPANTTYVAGSTTLNAVAVADVAGAMPYAAAKEIHSTGAASGTIANFAAAPNNKAIVSFKVTVNNITAPATSISNFATYSGTGIPATNTNTVTNAVLADLSLTKTVSNATPNVGSNVTFTVTVTNAGPSNATGVVVGDQLPSGYSFVSATPSQGSVSGTVAVVWTVGTLNNGASANIQIVATVLGSGVYTNTAQVTASNLSDPDSTPNNNIAAEDDQASVTAAPQADLSIDKTDNRAGITAGSIMNYTLTVTNNGPSSANGATISDPAAANLTKLLILSCTSAGSAVCPVLGNGAGQLNIANLEAGTVVIPTFPVLGSLVITVRVKVADSAAVMSNVTNTATVTAPAGMSDPTPANNTKADQDDVVAGAPTAVELIAFTSAGNARGGTTLQWRTGYEADNLGFNIYRDERGKRVKLNPALVAGSALLAGGRTVLTAGNGYAWTDARGTAGTGYWLEAVDTNGVSTWHGPVYANGGATSGGKLNPRDISGRQVLLLPDLNASANQDTQQEWAANGGELGKVDGLETGAGGPAPLLLAQAGQAVWTLPNEMAVKLAVRKTGWYRVSAAELAAAGFNANFNPALLQLFADGVEVPMRVAGKGNSLDSLEFYGRALDLPATDTRIYWLKAGPGQGLRLDARPAKAAQTPTATSFRSTVERKERLIYFSSLFNGEAENWFGPVISTNAAVQKLTTRFLDRTADSAALEFVLQGVTEQPHTVNVEVNGTASGTLTFAGRARFVTTLNVPTNLLLDGVNEIRLVAVASSADISLVESVRLSYQRSYVAVDDALSFSLGGGQTAFVGGFSTPNIRVLELGANDDAARELTVKVQAAGNGYGFALQGDQSARYLALGDQQFERAASVKLNTLSNWRAKLNAADLVIVTHRDFWTAANRLAVMRRLTEMRVAVVDVEDAYDEFGFGAKSPQAVKDLLTAARTTWLVKPKYALLIGDASTDPRDYLGLGNTDFVPTRLGATTYFETALDNWLADADGDGLPELALGRLPVRTAAQADALVTKILAFKPSASAPRPGLLVSDRLRDGVDFRAQAEQYAAALLPLMTKQFINRDPGTPDQVRAQILNAINLNKPLIVNWGGHGSTQVWTGDGLLRAQDAASLTNTAPSLFVMTTCLNGYFLDPTLTSLSEAVLLDAPGGAFAVVASSGLNEPSPQFVFNMALYQSLFGQGKTLGEAVTAARQAVTDIDVRNTYVLFGDPTMKLR